MESQESLCLKEIADEIPRIGWHHVTKEEKIIEH